MMGVAVHVGRSFLGCEKGPCIKYTYRKEKKKRLHGNASLGLGSVIHLRLDFPLADDLTFRTRLGCVWIRLDTDQAFRIVQGVPITKQ